MTNPQNSLPDTFKIQDFPVSVLKKVPIDFFVMHHILPLEWKNDVLTIAVTDSGNYHATDNLAMLLNARVETHVMDAKQIDLLLRKYLEQSAVNPKELLKTGTLANTGYTAEVYGEDLIQENAEVPVVQMVNAVLLEAVQAGATDIHFHSKGSDLAVLYRRDGLLHEVHRLPQSLREGMIARLKVMAKLDVSQRQLPQDGRFSIRSADREVEIRTSVVPTVQGERLVLRLLDKENLLIRASDLGMQEQDYQLIRKLIDRPHGMILVTGPTGSGKTTTLYSFISELNLESRNVMTIEDPVEYRVDGISQLQVKPAVGLTFAQGLRSILRQDPDVILVGEIRDQETAQIAVRAALTGHLVLATLHTTDAAGAITRLQDLQIEPYLISSALMTIISQRLVRKICLNCQGRACKSCFSTGYRGRTGLFELIRVQEEERKLVEQRASSQAFRDLMRKKGVLSLEEIGQKKVEEKVTTSEEIMRVIGMDQFWRNE